MSDLKDTAIMVTTFLRDDMLFRCIESIRKFYPDIPIFVGDNGRSNREKEEFCKNHNCEYFSLPFDIGVSGVRNETLKLIPSKYKYLMVIEDDMVFSEETKIEKLKEILEWEKDVGICGCLLRLKDGSEQHYEGRVWVEDDVHYIEKIRNPAWRKTNTDIKYYLCDLILNIFMMRREVWDDNPWDEQFKTALEHCDFFRALQTKTKWQVAYTPDIIMHHLQTVPDGYKEYRHRPIGWLLFQKKWGANYVISDYNRERPLSYGAMGSGKPEDMKGDNLKETIEILNRNQCTWWLEAGICLGAVREKEFILHDSDIDIGIHPKNIDLWDKLKEDFVAAGFKHYRSWTHNGKNYELSFRKRGVKVELFFFYDAGNFWYHGAFGPDKNGAWSDDAEFLPHVFSASLFQELEPIVFHGLNCFIPNPGNRYLLERYGPKWKSRQVEYLFWRDCYAIDRHFLRRGKKTVYIGGVWDLFHAGHLNILEEARRLGSRLIVGVLTDEAAGTYKEMPIIKFEERKRIVESIKSVDMVIAQNDKDPTEDWKKNNIKPHYVIHGDDWGSCPGQDYVRANGGKSVYFPYTKSISTTEIKRRIRNPKIAEKSSLERIAICMKTFLRDDVLYRTLNLLKSNIPCSYKFYIADDGTKNDKKKYEYEKLATAGHEIIDLPFNSGISFGRNATVQRAKEDYILVLDDDEILADPKSLQKMKAVLDSREDIGLVAAVLKQESGGFFGNENYAKGITLDLQDGLLVRRPARGSILNTDGVLYRIVDQVPNFFLAKKEIFKDVKWDNRIKIEYEHMDFFLELKKTKWKAAICLNAEAIHLKSDPDGEYYRYRRSAPEVYFLQKHNLKRVINQF